MIEQIMYLAIGFLLAMLCGLMVMPLVHNRAVRLTTKRLEATTPISMAEVQADKDQLRAEFAMAARRLEITVDQLKHKTTAQLAEIGKKSDAINRLKIELGDKGAAIFALEAREQALKKQLAAFEEELAARAATPAEAGQALDDRQGETDKPGHGLSDRATAAETRDAQLALLNAEITTLRARVEEAERDYASAQHKLADQRGNADTAARELTEARSLADSLRQRTEALDRKIEAQAGDQAKDAGKFAGRISDLETRLANLGKQLAEREYEAGLLRQDIEAARRTEADLRQQLAAGTADAAVEKLRAEKAALEEQLRAARDEATRAQHDLNAAQGRSESKWAHERMENALLRERINDIAAEVARLASTIEGPNSPIEAILAAAPTARETAANGSAPGIALPPGGTLADRIRALQSQAAQPRQNG